MPCAIIPGCTQAALAELLHADKAAIARRTKNLENKGLPCPPGCTRMTGGASFCIPRKRRKALKSSKAEIEASFYEYLTGVLAPEEAEAFAATAG